MTDPVQPAEGEQLSPGEADAKKADLPRVDRPVERTSSETSCLSPLVSKSTVKDRDAPSWLIDNIAEASKNASQIYLLYISFLAYSTLTVVTTTDRQIILKPAVLLPLINLNVPFDIFFTVGPLIALIIFLYLQFYICRLMDMLNNLRINYGRIDRNRLYPGIIAVMEYPDEGFLRKLQILLINFSLWWLFPIVLMIFSLWCIKRHDYISIVIGIIHIIVTIVIISFWKHISSNYQIYKYNFSQDIGKLVLFFIVVIFELSILLFILPSAKKGIAFDEKGILVEFIRKWTTVNLSHQKLVTEEKDNYEGLFWVYLEKVHLEGARLSFSVLRKANLQDAFLQKADLFKADLQNANLERVRFEGAKLALANLQDAKLAGACLQGADLREAKLQKADFSEADLSKAYLGAAKLQGANLGLAILREAELRGADLQGTRLVSANMQGAKLQNADLERAYLIRTDLEQADLTGVLNLTIEQLSIVCTLHQATLDQSLMEQIKEKHPHLLNKPKRNKKGKCIQE